MSSEERRAQVSLHLKILTGYVVLGAIIEKISGGSYAKLFDGTERPVSWSRPWPYCTRCGWGSRVWRPAASSAGQQQIKLLRIFIGFDYVAMALRTGCAPAVRSNVRRLSLRSIGPAFD